jgi:hypothetical protein
MDRFTMILAAEAAEEYRKEHMEPHYEEATDFLEGKITGERAESLHRYMVRTQAIYYEILYYDHQKPRGD